MNRTERRHDDGPIQVNANDLVAFLVEVAALVLLGVAGWQLGGPTFLQVLLALALPGAAAALWGLFAAPRARVRSRPLELATKTVVLGAGVAAGFLVLPLPWAVAFALVVVVNTVLLYAGPLARR
ncbi:MAG TPA: YrdB family protein [Marmoricola sp.]|nr:YrdB family protein [Marmoricola sp.]